MENYSSVRFFKKMKGEQQMDTMFGFQPLLGIISHIFFIAVAFYSLQALRIDQLIKKNRVFQAQLLYIFLSIVIGSAVSNFFLEISYWSGRIPYMFQ